MKKLLLLSGWFVLSGVLTAGVLNFPVTPATLPDWQLDGADRDKLQAGDTMLLPGGSEISRTFRGGAVVLYSVSTPHFSGTFTDWPIVQVGPAALALIRQGTNGQLVLLVGDVVSTLAVSIPLTPEGDSLEPLELALGYDPVTKVGIIVLADRAFSFRGATSEAGIEVALAPGERTPWTQDSLEIMVIGPDDPAEADKNVRDADAAKHAALLQSAADKLRVAGGLLGGALGRPARWVDGAGSMAGSTLEVYTPPAVRKAATERRAAIGQRRNN